MEKTEHPLPLSELPDWLPLPVAEAAHAVYDKISRYDRKLDRRFFTASEEIKVLLRLASDPRMKTVWNELLKKDRRHPGQYLHPFQMPEPTDEHPQEDALGFFFSYAWDLATCGIELETSKKRKPFLRMASKLQRDAKALRSLSLDEFASDLEAKAIVCTDLAKPTLNTIFPNFIERSRGDDEVRAFVLRLSAVCRDYWFGKVLTATIATTASVALGKKVTADQVRNIARSLPRA